MATAPPRAARLALLLGLLCAPPGQAVEVKVAGLFKDRAVLVIDGRQRLLRAGQTSPEGVTLVAADSEQATIEVAGQRSTHRLGTGIASSFAPPAVTSVRLAPDEGDMYSVGGSINGFAVRFVLDTGASAVAFNSDVARRLGIDYQRTGVAGMAATPAGPVATHGVVLDRVRVGEIELRDVNALVIEGPYPREVLLGMSFLGRLEMRQDGRMLELRKRR